MIQLRNVTTLFLDLDGTLLDLRFDNFFWQELVPARFAERRGLPVSAARQHLAPLFQATQGQLAWYCLEHWSQRLDLDLIALKREVAALIAPLPHAEPFLDHVQQLPCRVVLVTNAHPAALAIKLERCCWHARFDAIVVSHHLGHAKESPEFWQTLARIEPYDPVRTLLVDDSLAVLRAARQGEVGHLLAIRKNDSTLPPRIITEFSAIDDFRALLPSSPGRPMAAPNPRPEMATADLPHFE